MWGQSVAYLSAKIVFHPCLKGTKLSQYSSVFRGILKLELITVFKSHNYITRMSLMVFWHQSRPFKAILTSWGKWRPQTKEKGKQRAWQHEGSSLLHAAALPSSGEQWKYSHLCWNVAQLWPLVVIHLEAGFMHTVFWWHCMCFAGSTEIVISTKCIHISF